jgi:hypothetical protein
MLLRKMTEHTTSESVLAAHMKKCYMCQHCKTYRVKNSGHETRCNEASVTMLKLIGREKGWDPCPLCSIPYHHRIGHLKAAHHLDENELQKYRLVAKRGWSAEESLLNAENLKAARKKVRPCVCFTDFWSCNTL